LILKVNESHLRLIFHGTYQAQTLTMDDASFFTSFGCSDDVYARYETTPRESSPDVTITESFSVKESSSNFVRGETHSRRSSSVPPTPVAANDPSSENWVRRKYRNLTLCSFKSSIDEFLKALGLVSNAPEQEISRPQTSPPKSHPRISGVHKSETQTKNQAFHGTTCRSPKISYKMAPKSNQSAPVCSSNFEPLTLDMAKAKFPSWMLVKYGRDLLKEDDYFRLKTENVSDDHSFALTTKQNDKTRIQEKPQSHRDPDPDYPDWMIARYGQGLLGKLSKTKNVDFNKRKFSSVSPNRMTKLRASEVLPQKTRNTTKKLSYRIEKQLNPDEICLEECNHRMKGSFGKGYLIPGCASEHISEDPSDHSGPKICMTKSQILENAMGNYEYYQSVDLMGCLNEYLDPFSDYQKYDIDFTKRKGYLLHTVGNSGASPHPTLSAPASTVTRPPVLSKKQPGKMPGNTTLKKKPKKNITQKKPGGGRNKVISNNSSVDSNTIKSNNNGSSNSSSNNNNKNNNININCVNSNQQQQQQQKQQ